MKTCIIEIRMNREERKPQEVSMKVKKIQETVNHSDGAPKSNVPPFKEEADFSIIDGN